MQEVWLGVCPQEAWWGHLMESNAKAEERNSSERKWKAVFPEIQWRKVFVSGTQSGSEVSQGGASFAISQLGDGFKMRVVIAFEMYIISLTVKEDASKLDFLCNQTAFYCLLGKCHLISRPCLSLAMAERHCPWLLWICHLMKTSTHVHITACHLALPLRPLSSL